MMLLIKTIAPHLFQGVNINTADERDLTFLRETTLGTVRTNASSQVRIKTKPDVILLDNDEVIDTEAEKLYEWTQELSFDELIATPRVATGT